MKEQFRNFCYEATSVFVVAAILIAIIFTFFARFVGVVGDSMNPTLESGDWVVITETVGGTYKPKYGDIVVVAQSSELKENLIKRVIATEGQTVDIDFSTGKVYIDGNEIIERYIANETTLYYDVLFPVTVPEGQCFVLGDNRQNSIDSRSSIVGFIDNRTILGKAGYAITLNGVKDLDYRKSK